MANNSAGTAGTTPILAAGTSQTANTASTQTVNTAGTQTANTADTSGSQTANAAGNSGNSAVGPGDVLLTEQYFSDPSWPRTDVILDLSKSKYSGIVPFLVVFSLDKRCRTLNPPSDRSYSLSDGVAPDVERLKDLVFESKLPMKSTPAYTLRWGRRSRRDEYDTTIQRDRKSTRLNSSHRSLPRMPSSA